ncbi:MAG TPA: TonB-dependent receptor, partial [Phnomibacter sp.]|nr:TonB-dependent receptor [Phnomibacter sp.]
PCTFPRRGPIPDAHTNEPLAGAPIGVGARPGIIAANEQGQYQLTGLCAGTLTLTVSHVACQTQQVVINLRRSQVKNILLHHQKLDLPDVVVRGFSNNQTQASSRVAMADVLKSRGVNLAEVLSQVNGVRMLATGSTIAKPVIHGLHSNRILIMNNGVRLEGQQWGAEHAPEVDPYVAGKFTLIKGAAAVRYGADAIGGVVQVEPRPMPQAAGLRGEANLAAFSNNAMGVGSLLLEQKLASSPLSWRLQTTYKKGGNTRIPGYWLMNTGLQEWNYSGTLAYRQEHWGTELFYSRFNTRLGLYPGAHVETVDDLNAAFPSKSPLPSFRSGFSYAIERPRQQVSHQTLKLSSFYRPAAHTKYSLVFSHQQNQRDEYDSRAFIALPEMSLTLNTTGAEALLEKTFAQKHLLQVGLSGQRQENINGPISARQFIRNYLSYNAAAFAIWQTSIHRWDAEAGLRYDYRWFESYYRPAGSSQIEGHNRQFSNVSASLGTAYRLSAAWQLKANIATAWRPPAPNEMYANGVHQGLASVEIGNPDFAAERALNTNLVLTGRLDSNWTVSITAYQNFIQDFIYLAPTPPPVLTIRGYYPVFPYRQTNARLSGLDADIGYRYRRWEWSAK